MYFFNKILNFWLIFDIVWLFGEVYVENCHILFKWNFCLFFYPLKIHFDNKNSKNCLKKKKKKKKIALKLKNYEIFKFFCLFVYFPIIFYWS